MIKTFLDFEVFFLRMDMYIYVDLVYHSIFPKKTLAEGAQVILHWG